MRRHANLYGWLVVGVLLLAYVWWVTSVEPFAGGAL